MTPTLVQGDQQIKLDELPDNICYNIVLRAPQTGPVEIYNVSPREISQMLKRQDIFSIEVKGVT